MPWNITSLQPKAEKDTKNQGGVITWQAGAEPPSRVDTTEHTFGWHRTHMEMTHGSLFQSLHSMASEPV